jgi:hypothetical protein
MKILILIVVLAVGSVAVIPKPKDIVGTWVLETSEKNTEAAILRIKMSEGYFEGTIDIPGQQVYDHPVWIRLKKDEIKIMLDDKGACFIEGIVSDSALAGRSVVTGKSSDVKFRRVKIYP